MRRTILAALAVIGSVIGSAAAPTASASPPSELEFVGHGRQTITESIHERSVADPVYREKAIAWMKAVGPRVRNGHKLGELRTSPSELRSIIEQLRALRSSQKPALTGVAASSAKPPAVGMGEGVMPAAVGTFAATWDDPNSWSVVGTAQGDRSYWRSDGDLGMFRGVCNPSCSTTDQIEIRFTVTPTKSQTTAGGSLGSRVEAYLRYFPSTGRFSGIHVDTWGITTAYVMYRSSPGSAQLPIGVTKRAYAKNDRDLSGKRLTVAVQLWAMLNGQWKWDAGKTADCIGRSGSDVRCFY